MFSLMRVWGTILKRDKPKYKQILEAAIVVIAENGYHHAQVSKIAKQAGVADGTIYLYFESKEDLLISVFSEKTAMFVEALKDIINEEKSTSKRILRLIENHFQMLSMNQQFATVTQIEIRQSSGELRAKINPIIKEYLMLFDQILNDGVASGELVKELDIRLARQMVFGIIDGISTTWVMNEFRYDLVEQAPKVHQILMHGIQAK